MKNQPNWKVIHLSTSSIGGAGLAARRLNESLNHAGIDSKFFALQNRFFQNGINEFSIPRTVLNKITSFLVSRIQIHLSNKVLFTFLSINSNYVKILNEFANPKDTIIHFHNWFNLISQKKILELSKKGYKIIVTLHDQRFMTGGCHYALSCNGFETKCGTCPGIPFIFKKISQINVNRMLKLIQELDNRIYFISPSNWILGEAHKSILLREANVLFIPNTLGLLNSEVKELYFKNYDIKKIVRVGVASMDPDSYIKCGDIINDLITQRDLLKSKVDFIFMKNFKQDKIGLEEFWKSIDFLLVLSRADNSPNVVHEAKFRGVPLIASSVGGISEMLDPDFDVAISVDNLNSQDIADVLEKLSISTSFNNKRRSMQNRFNDYVNDSVNLHIKLYSKMMVGKP